MDDKIDSHIQIPKSLLKRFSFPGTTFNDKKQPEKHRFIYCMDMNCNITVKDIKDCNVIYGYYEKNIESYLSTFETAVGNIKDKFLYIKDQTKKLKVYSSYNNSIRDFISISLLRSPSVLQGIIDKSVFIDIINNEPQNIPIYFYSRSRHVFDKWFENYTFRIIENMTDINFIIPQNCFYLLNNPHIEYIIPISPKHAILFSKIVYDSINLKINKNEISTVDLLNKLAIKIEFQNNKQNVYASNQADLEKYATYAQEQMNEISI